MSQAELVKSDLCASIRNQRKALKLLRLIQLIEGMLGVCALFLSVLGSLAAWIGFSVAAVCALGVYQLNWLRRKTRDELSDNEKLLSDLCGI